MSTNSLNKKQLPGFIYLIDIILKDSRKTEDNLYKEIAAWNSPGEKTRNFQAFFRAFKLRAYLKQDEISIKKITKPSIVTLNILTSYYFEGKKPTHFEDFTEQYQDNIQSYYEENRPTDYIINTLFETKENKFNNHVYKPIVTTNQKKVIPHTPHVTRNKKVLLTIILLVTLSFFGYQILFKRTIEITSSQEKEIVIFSSSNNKLKELGKLNKSNNYKLKVRLQKGELKLYFYSTQDKDGKEYPGAEIIEILPIWEPMEPIILSKI